MTHSIQFSRNRATANQIADHLLLNDEAFSPRLSERVEISEYALKIAARAERFEAWANGTLVGLIAAYCNDLETRTAYITSVSVVRAYRKRGLAARLLIQCVEFVKRRQFERISLEVDRTNQPAVDLYEACGFRAMKAGGQTIRMQLNTREDVRMGSQS